MIGEASPPIKIAIKIARGNAHHYPPSKKKQYSPLPYYPNTPTH